MRQWHPQLSRIPVPRRAVSSSLMLSTLPAAPTARRALPPPGATAAGARFGERRDQFKSGARVALKLDGKGPLDSHTNLRGRAPDCASPSPPPPARKVATAPDRPPCTSRGRAARARRAESPLRPSRCPPAATRGPAAPSRCACASAARTARSETEKRTRDGGSQGGGDGGWVVSKQGGSGTMASSALLGVSPHPERDVQAKRPRRARERAAGLRAPHVLLVDDTDAVARHAQDPLHDLPRGERAIAHTHTYTDRERRTDDRSRRRSPGALEKESEGRPKAIAFSFSCVCPVPSCGGLWARSPPPRPPPSPRTSSWRSRARRRR